MRPGRLDESRVRDGEGNWLGSAFLSPWAPGTVITTSSDRPNTRETGLTRREVAVSDEVWERLTSAVEAWEAALAELRQVWHASEVEGRTTYP